MQNLNGNPLISIVTISFNSASFIEETIKSVLAQVYENYEYILIDGNSNDGTQEIIKKYKNYISYFVSEPDEGIFDAMNKGLAQALGKWIIFMNAGDFFYNKNLLVNIFSNTIADDVELIYGDVCLYSPTDEYYVLSKTNNLKINLNAICHQSVFIKRNLHPSFDASYKLCADHNLIYDFIKRGHYLYFNFPVSRILIGGVSSNLKETRYEKLRITFSKGNLIDKAFGLWFYTYGTLKEFVKKILLILFPHNVFIFIRSLKNQIEQL